MLCRYLGLIIAKPPMTILFTSAMLDNKNFYDPTTAKYFDPKCTHRVAIVTGGNSGIGWYTVLHLYLHGYTVYVAGRNQTKVQKAVEDIKSEAVKRALAYTVDESKGRYLGNLEFINFDCCDLKSVDQCATAFLSRERKLHVLINNAGVMAIPFEVTKDNYEIQYQVNFVAPFLFTLRLLPALKAAQVDGYPRVVGLSSIAHHAAIKYYHPSDQLNWFPLPLFSWIRYGNAKCAVIEFTKKFSELYPGVIAFAVHPGVIPDTQLFDWWDNLPYIGGFFTTGKNMSGYFIGATKEEGSLASLRAAMDQSFGPKNNGTYLVTGGKFATPSRVALNPQNIDTTWYKNLEMLKERNFVLSI